MAGKNNSEIIKIADEADNYISTAGLKKGEVVLHLGCGEGLDMFLAADKIGSEGKAIGLDRSIETVQLARRNAEKKGLKPPHVAFVQTSFNDELPIESLSVDCIISNCIANLLPYSGKASLLREAYRVLKPGGRINFTDIIAKSELPDGIRNDLMYHISCISGAVTQQMFETVLKDAGFVDISFVDTGSDLNDKDPARKGYHHHTASQTVPTNKPALDANIWIGLYRISANKPKTSESTSPTVLKRWWDAYPEVKSSPERISAEELAALMRDPSKGKAEYLVVDVRRNDHAGGHVRNSIQCPAQTFYDDMPGYFEEFKNSRKVLFYCQSSNGRGPRCAGWYQDHLNAVDCSSSKAYILTGGIKGWMAKYGDQTDLVDYD